MFLRRFLFVFYYFFCCVLLLKKKGTLGRQGNPKILEVFFFFVCVCVRVFFCCFLLLPFLFLFYDFYFIWEKVYWDTYVSVKYYIFCIKKSALSLYFAQNTFHTWWYCSPRFFLTSYGCSLMWMR